jgi:hypothetical protein
MPMRGLVLLLLGLLLAPPAAGQGGRPLRVRGERALTFGVVFPGVPTHVLRTDPVGSGEFSIRGEKFLQVLMQFTLPTSLTGPGGAAMPLSFGAGDAGYSTTTIGAQAGFNPNVGGTGQLSKNGQGSVFLGGTAQPTSGQAAGSYTGIVVLTVIPL